MEPNKLDDLFKGKLGSNPDVDFNPQHWEDARILLQDKESNKPWFLLLLVLLGLLLNGWISHVTHTDERTPDVFESSSLEIPQTAELKTDNKVETEEIYSADDEISDTKLSSTSTVTISEETPGIGPDKPLDNNLKVGIVESELPKVSSHATFENSQEDAKEEIGGKAEVDRKVPEVYADKPVESKGIDKIRSTSTVAMLQPCESGLISYNRQEMLVALADDALSIEAEVFRKTRLGVTLNLLVGPSEAVVHPIRGMSFGMTIDRFFKPNIYAGISPSIRLQFNETGFSKFQESLSYGFGADNTTYGLQASSLQYLRLPVYAGYLFDRHALEGGLAVDWLVSARGRLQEINVDGQTVEVVEEFEEGWIDTDEMKSLSSSLFLGYKFQWSEKLRIGIDVYYQFGTNYPGLPNDQSQLLTAQWYTGIQGTYYFK